MSSLRFFKLNEIPTVIDPNTVYLINNPELDLFDLYLSSSDGLTLKQVTSGEKFDEFVIKSTVEPTLPSVYPFWLNTATGALYYQRTIEDVPSWSMLTNETPTPQQIGAEPAGTASALMATHLSENDPHPQYVMPSEVAGLCPVSSVQAGTHGVEVTQPTTGNIVVDGQISIYNQTGLISASSKLKVFVGSATTDANGLWSIDMSSAGFTTRPFCVQATALGPIPTLITDPAWVTVSNSYTATLVQGYALKGNSGNIILGGAWTSVRVSPNTLVNVTAVGI